MADARGPIIADLVQITPDGLFVDRHRVPVSDEVTVETVSDDLHLVSVQILAAHVDVTDSPTISRTGTATYRRVHHAEGGESDR